MDTLTRTDPVISVYVVMCVCVCVCVESGGGDGGGVVAVMSAGVIFSHSQPASVEGGLVESGAV